MRRRLRSLAIALLLAACAFLPACRARGPANLPDEPVPNAAAPAEDDGGYYGPGIGLLIAFTIAIIVFHRREKNEPEP
mgnify:CR=1 FL=1